MFIYIGRKSESEETAGQDSIHWVNENPNH